MYRYLNTQNRFRAENSKHYYSGNSDIWIIRQIWIWIRIHGRKKENVNVFNEF